MRRLPASLLVLVPLALGLLYAAGYALLAPRPDLEDVVPRMAVLTARFRGVEAMDQHWFLDRPQGLRVSEVVAAARNVEGLPGVDRSGPIHFVLLPRESRSDVTLLILPLADEAALRRRFEGHDKRPDDPRGLQRRAQHLETFGDFAALAWDREAVRHLGEGGVTCEDRGEDFAVAADVPALVALALSSAGQPPWRKLVEALGAEPGKAETKVDPTTGARSIKFPMGRVPDLAQAWKAARLWAWKQRKEVEIELEPSDAGLLADLKAAAAERAGPPGEVPESALAWLEVHGVAGRRTLTRALHLVGVKGVEVLIEPDPSPADARTLRVSAVANQAEGHGWTVVVHAVDGALPSRFRLRLGEDLPAGAAPFTLSDSRWDGPSPAGKVRLRIDSASSEALVVGADAELVAAGGHGRVKSGRPVTTLPEASGHRTLARFGLAAQRVNDVLGPALSSGGIFSVLAGGGIHGDVTTDGRILRIRLRTSSP